MIHNANIPDQTEKPCSKLGQKGVLFGGSCVGQVLLGGEGGTKEVKFSAPPSGGGSWQIVT